LHYYQGNRISLMADNPLATLGAVRAVVAKFVIPAESGIQRMRLDTGFRRCDEDSSAG